MHFFSSAANLWSFCICFALKRSWCKWNQHIKVHLSLEDREQGGNLSHLSPCHLPGDLGAVHSCGVPCLGVLIPLIIISFFSPPPCQNSQPLPRYSGKILSVKALSLALLLWAGASRAGRGRIREQKDGDPHQALQHWGNFCFSFDGGSKKFF